MTYPYELLDLDIARFGVCAVLKFRRRFCCARLKILPVGYRILIEKCFGCLWFLVVFGCCLLLLMLVTNVAKGQRRLNIKVSTLNTISFMYF